MRLEGQTLVVLVLEVFEPAVVEVQLLEEAVVQLVWIDFAVGKGLRMGSQPEAPVRMDERAAVAASAATEMRSGQHGTCFLLFNWGL